MMKHSLSLHTSIYDLKKILQAVDAFKALASIRVRSANEYHVCDFTKCKHDVLITQKEFENYVIDLMNINHDT